MGKANFLTAVTCIVFLGLGFSLHFQPAGAQVLQSPGAFSKSTPIDLSAFLSVWTIPLHWETSLGAAEYEYCFDITDDNLCDSSWSSASTNTSAEISGLEANTTYYWQARAVNGGETTEADGGEWWEFTTGSYARFHVQLVENNIFGVDWRPGSSLTVTVDDPSNGSGIDFTDTKTADSNGYALFFDLNGLQLSAGMYVTMTDGIVLKSHTVTNLQLSGVAVDTDTVWGTANNVGAHVVVQYCQYNGCLWRRYALVQNDGTWQADFSVPGISPDEQEILDIVPGISGEVLEGDADADHTDINWQPLHQFVAMLDQDRIFGVGWAVGASVSIEINDPATLANPDYTETTALIVAPWDESQSWFNLDLNGNYLLKAGDVVTVTGDTATKVHTVTSLQILNIFPITDVVSGLAAPGSYVDLQACGDGGCSFRTELADINGNWSANFHVVGDQPWEQTTIDILADTYGNSSQSDDDADATGIQWPETRTYNFYLPIVIRNN